MPTPDQIAPHGGALVNQLLTGPAADEARALAGSAPQIALDDVALADVQMIASGAYSPLSGFVGRDDYERIVAEGRLANGTLWPIPIALAVSDEQAEQLRDGAPVALVGP